MDKRLRPIGTIVPEFIHKRDQGPLKIIKYGTIQSIEVEVYRCEVCGEEFDFTDWESIVQSPSWNAFIETVVTDAMTDPDGFTGVELEPPANG